MLGVSALHEYRQVGGHGVNGKIVHQRIIDIDKAIQKLSNLFPGLLKFTPDKPVSAAGMKYRFYQRVERHYSWQELIQHVAGRVRTDVGLKQWLRGSVNIVGCRSV